MEKLRQIKRIQFSLLLLLMLTFVVVAAKLLLFSTKNFSSTPQQITVKLEAAVRSRNEEQLAALFISKEAFAEFRDVPRDTMASQTSPLTLNRGPKDFYLDAWNSWFDKNEQNSFDFRKDEDGVIRCTDKNQSFGFGLKQSPSGYLFDGFSYTV